MTAGTNYCSQPTIIGHTKSRLTGTLKISLLLLGSCITMFDTSIVSLDQLTQFRLIVLGASLALIVPGLLRPRALRFRAIGKAVMGSWFCFGTLLLISTLVNQDNLGVALSSVWMAVCVPALFFVAMPNANGPHFLRSLVAAVVVCCATLLLSCVLYEAPVHLLYRGALGHPNFVGLVSSLLYTALLALCGRHWSAMKKKQLGACLFGMAATLTVLCMSTSRTSITACVAVTITLIMLEIRRRRVVSKVAIITGIVVVLASLSTTEFVQAGIDAIGAKNDAQARTGDVLSGRVLIWTRVLDGIQPFGNGGQYFETTIGIDAHNGFMRMLGERGPAAAGALVIFAILSLLAGYKYAVDVRNTSHYSCAPLLLIIYFWTMAQGEGMFGSFGNAGTLAMFMAVGVAVRAPTVSRAPVINGITHRLTYHF